MNLLSVSALSKSYGERVLFTDVNFGIARGEKVALVADNGSGKTTLFKIIRGNEIPDTGEVVFRKELRVGYLEQDFTLPEEKSIEQIIHGAENPFVAAMREYEAAVKDAENGNAQRLDNALQQMNRLNAWEYEKNIKEILSRLEIRDTTVPLRTLSGGQKKRVALALTLIDSPELLILDEPTNHLDIEMIEWLEDYLSNADLSVLFVTHDRYFLDNVSTRIIELDGGSLYEYNGDLTYYLEKKAARLAAADAETARARNLYRRELEWVRKMPKARGTKAKARLDAFEDLEEKARRRTTTARVQLDVKMSRLGSKILELHKVSKRFGERELLKNMSYTFISGEKVGLVGKNGSGKSTLIKIILGLLPPDTGKVVTGDTVVFGYYSQAGIEIDPGKRIIEVVQEIAEHIPLSDGASVSASQLLSRFNFPPARQYTRVEKLSGGEKRRLYLLTVLAKNPNFLVLDEPGNDLDLLTLQTLEEFLDEFKGCVLIASHDRFLLDRLADHTFALEGDGEVKDFPGGYSGYREWKRAQKVEQRSTVTAEKPVVASETSSLVTKKLSYKLQRELESLEKEIPQLEERKLRLSNELSEGITDYNEIQRISSELADLEKDLELKTLRWMELTEAAGDS